MTPNTQCMYYYIVMNRSICMECRCMNDVYMPTIVITIILEFSIGLQNGF